MNKVVVIAGPTASGKSALALKIAETFDGIVINADSMQVYDGLRVLTAQPSAEDAGRVPHRLYGVLPPSEVCSAGRWCALAAEACGEARAAGRLPVVVGGTGLYLKALMEGLSPVPDVPDLVRAETRERFAVMGNAAFHRALAEIDPVMAARLHPSNSQRLMRAWEVKIATGRSLADWQAEPATPALDARFFTLLVMPPRERLYARCDARFAAMIGQGALAEVHALLECRLDPALPILRALGFGELAAHLRGEMALEAAVAAAQQATRRYAKRQMTWFRHQLTADQIIGAQLSESLEDGILPIIRQFLLTETE
ncbi:tRNA (adenosine(37)-N6)-dimethylallyltransferase MiaA [Telmatospirillum siberiense]|uniref:tRNA dimethylallyltransferase n=2 Tax=Telmatospirillum siberiense TaxID=382514 RepID=A0A2N3PW58_9PROT|nr:tRNA (adenosine(37)-N6)-dimethylallyltransferase MiaA [Telmatospirillum siberiense]PKU24639.1 tRNA (adenosine(37)-N6)-dimethylallyltransferase MiaA [Telmatospirillum siberiense]